MVVGLVLLFVGLLIFWRVARKELRWRHSERVRIARQHIEEWERDIFGE